MRPGMSRVMAQAQAGTATPFQWPAAPEYQAMTACCTFQGSLSRCSSIRSNRSMSRSSSVQTSGWYFL